MSLAFPKGPNRVGASLLLPKDGLKSNLRKVVFTSYLEFRTMDKVQEPSDFECYTPPSEPFRFYLLYSRSLFGLLFDS
jgi:hypothetical protein